MIYLKKYEELTAKYKKGDYVVVNLNSNKFYNFIKILSNGEDTSEKLFGPTKIYDVEYIFTENQKIDILTGTVYEFNIERLCTPDEAKEYEIKKLQTIFNL